MTLNRVSDSEARSGRRACAHSEACERASQLGRGIVLQPPAWNARCGSTACECASQLGRGIVLQAPGPQRAGVQRASVRLN